MFDAMPSPRRRRLAPLFYTLAGLAALFELGVVWLMLHPNAHKDYADFYIDHTTTCLNQPKAGPYVIGEVIPFASEGYGPEAADMRVCGWDGPAGDGLHSVGTTSRIRMAFAPITGNGVLRIELTGVEHGIRPEHIMDLIVNGTNVETIAVGRDQTRTITVPLPANVLAAEPGTLDLTFAYHDAVRVGPEDPDGRRRAIKLLSLQLSAE